jgi:hypothetical protein
MTTELARAYRCEAEDVSVPSICVNGGRRPPPRGDGMSELQVAEFLGRYDARIEESMIVAECEALEPY